METYGKELILDIHNCNKAPFFRGSIINYCMHLCNLIGMEREDIYFWDYDGIQEEYDKAPAHLKGISAVQFIKTSNITIHTLDDMKRVYLNIFSCKDFDANQAASFTAEWFGGKIVSQAVIERK